MGPLGLLAFYELMRDTVVACEANAVSNGDRVYAAEQVLNALMSERFAPMLDDTPMPCGQPRP
jgi:hypothetical protein